jgi:hypothetical protein
MDFLKKHYEKVLLGAMLAGLIGVLVFMLFFIRSDTEEMAQKRDSYINPRVKELTNLDMTILDGAMARLKAPYLLDLETTNKLFNPLEWQRGLDGNLLLAQKRTGVQVAVVTNMTPLYTIVSLDSVITNELGVRYVIKVERQAAPTSAKRRPVPHYVSKGDKANNDFALLDVKGAPEAPDGLVVKLVDTGEVVTIGTGKPYRRVDGYAVDFRYDPERKAFHNRRAGDRVAFGGSDYTVVEVNEHELILQDLSNQKKTSLPFNP